MIVPLKEKEETRDMLEEFMENAGPEEKTCEIAILGEPTAQAWAEVKVRSIVEKHHPGRADKERNHTLGLASRQLKMLYSGYVPMLSRTSKDAR